MPIWHRLAKFLILILEGIIKKISLGYVPKNDEKNNSGGKGLILTNDYQYAVIFLQVETLIINTYRVLTINML